MHGTESATIRFLEPAIALLLALLCLHFVFRTEDARRMGITSTPLVSGSLDSEKWRLYDSDPDHIWNRLYRNLFLRVAKDGREYGYDELDPLLWRATRHLLGGPACRQAIASLDEFQATRAERLISDPLKRAILQRDLWAIFDWTTQTSTRPSRDVRDLQLKLAQAIRRLSMPAEQIEALPDTYGHAVAARTFAANYDPGHPEAPFLPPDLFQPGGDWVPLNIEGGGSVAPGHVAGFSGRSVFQVFIRLPQGRDATLAYLRRVSAFPKPWVRNGHLTDILPNPKLPQFPNGTRLALIRQMVIIDEKVELIPTKIVESVQIRVHRANPAEIPEGFNADRNEARSSLDVYEFKLSRAKLFAGDSGGLRAVGRNEKEFPLFQSHGIDLFDLQQSGHESIERHLRPVLDSCSGCHFRPGIHSVLSRMPDIVLLRAREVRRNLIPSSDLEQEANTLIEWKQSQESWRLLREMWHLRPAAPLSNGH